MERVAFRKMHGLGNDFVIVDARMRALDLDKAAIRRIADRRYGIGCDQFLILEKAHQGGDLFMRIYNPDGSETGACGNGTRCVARMLMEETGRSSVTIETIAGRLEAERKGDLVCVDMGVPKRIESAILDEAKVSIVDMGNPHLIFFVPDADAVDLASLGPKYEKHEMFPQGVNVTFAAIRARNEIKLRVWERGAGATLACGSAACATLVAAVSRDLADREAQLHLPGGTLTIVWREDQHVLMTGPTELSFEGVIGAAA